jgi:hypothetical protein
MTGQHITKKMLFSRYEWICSVTKISFILEDSPFGWYLYLPEKKGGLKEIAYQDNRKAMFNTLKSLYELAIILDEKEKQRTTLKPDEISN